MYISIENDFCKAISKAAYRISNHLSQNNWCEIKFQEQFNSYNEKIKSCDFISNQIIIEELKSTHYCGGVASEELENPILFDNKNAKYVVVIDPLDGSSNVDLNITVGTIFALYKVQTKTEKDFLQPGKEIILAGYILYGPRTTMILAAHGLVKEYTLLNKSYTESQFIETKQNIKCPEEGKWISANVANIPKWKNKTSNWYTSISKNEKYSHRYVGSLVADVHRTLLEGGIFAYPEDQLKKKSKLRLLYECNPIAFVMECASGMAVNEDMERILNIDPVGFHDCVSFITGSMSNINDLKLIYGK